MTDKQRILSEIERKYNEWKLGSSAEAKYRCEAYKELIELIKPMQEETVNKVLDTESMIESHKQKLISQVNGMKDSPFVNMCLDSYKQGISEILDTLNLSNVEKTVKDWKEPVREELAQAAITAADEDMQGRQIMEESNENRQLYSRIFRRAFKAGAKWQYEQFEKNRLGACDRQTKEEAKIEMDFVTSIIEKEHRLPTYDDAIKYGMKLKEQQMMASAVDACVTRFREYKEENEVDFTVMQEKGDFSYAIEDEVKLIIIKDK